MYAALSGPQMDDRSLVQVATASNGLSLWLPAAGGDGTTSPGGGMLSPLGPLYLPGDVVQGKLRGSFKERLTARAVRVRLTCEVHIHFHRGSGKNRTDYRKTVQFCPVQTITLQGSEKGGSGATFPLQPGIQYEWDFQLPLPSGNLPGTLYFTEGTHITYNLNCFIDIPNWPDAELKHDLNVGGAPLALTEAMGQPVDIHEVAGVNACFGCLRKGDAVLHLALPRGAVVPFIDGQPLTGALMPVMVGVDNVASSRALQSVTLKLKGEVWMSSDWASQRVPFTVAQLELASGVEAGQSLAVRPVEFPGLMMVRTPALNALKALVLQQPTTEAAGILRITYRLSLTVYNGCGSKLKVSVPLTFAPAYPERFPAALQPQDQQQQQAVPSAPLVEAEAYAAPSHLGGDGGKPFVLPSSSGYDMYAGGTGLGGAPIAYATPVSYPPSAV